MKTKIVGICNVTPDSFSDGGEYFSPERAVKRVQDLFDQGADFVDVGAESTRPGAQAIDADEEWRRLHPVLELLSELNFTRRLSLDTMHPANARRFIELGGYIINDVTGMQTPEMIEVIAEYPKALGVVSHLPASTPALAHALEKKVDDIEEVKEWLIKRVIALHNLGVRDDQLILDPGIGFGKTIDLNHTLLRFSKFVDYPVMIGYSRKRFLGPNRLGISTNLAAGKIAINSGAAYLRVHDVAEHVDLRTDMGLS